MTDDQLDKVYREYFQHEVPAELPPIVKSEVPRLRGESHSRFVLAASIAALLGLGYLVSSNLLPSKPQSKGSASSIYKDAEADGKKLLDSVEMP